MSLFYILKFFENRFKRIGIHPLYRPVLLMSFSMYSLKISDMLLPVLMDLEFTKDLISSFRRILIDSPFLSVVGLPV